jgi:hypothetical protein
VAEFLARRAFAFMLFHTPAPKDKPQRGYLIQKNKELNQRTAEQKREA